MSTFLKIILNLTLGTILVACSNESAVEDPPQLAEFPLGRDDARAQLDPALLDVLGESAPDDLTIGIIPKDKPRRLEYDVWFDIVTGEEYSVDKSTQDGSGAGTPGTNQKPIGADTDPEVDLFSPGQEGSIASDQDDDGLGSASQALIWGTDDRWKIEDTIAFPWRTKVRLFVKWPNIEEPRVCSGSLIGPKSILTAGHCVYRSANGGWASWVRAVPALDRTYMPFADAGAARFNSVSNWTVDEDLDFDYALITLDRRVGEATGWTGLCSITDSSWENRLFDIGGYPDDKSGGTELWVASGIVLDYNSTNIYHNASTVSGMSGAGMDPWGLTSAYTCAVHSGSNSQYNRATRITNARFSRINGWISANDAMSEVDGDTLLWVWLAGTTYHPVAATTPKSGHYFDIFVRGTGGAIYHKTRTQAGYVPAINTYLNIGGNTIEAPAAVSRAAGLIDVFIRNNSGQVLTKAWNGSSWLPSTTGWWSLGGNIVGAPTVVSWGSNRLDVFGRGPNGHVQHIAWNGSSWGSWQDLGGDTSDTIAVVSIGANLLDIFIRDRTTGSVLTKWWNGSSWQPSQANYMSLGGAIKGPPTALATSSNRIDVFIRNSAANDVDGVFSKTWVPGGWSSNWTSLGGKTTAPIAAVARAPGLYDIFVRGMSGGIFTKAWTGTSWWPSQSGWANLGGDMYDVSVTSSASNRLEVFARRRDNSVVYKFWDGTRWWL